MSKECPNCGYAFSASDAKCPYCGTANPDYVPTEKPAAARPASPTQNYVSNPGSKQTPAKKKEPNWIIFIILLIICWPIAIVYLLVKIA